MSDLGSDSISRSYRWAGPAIGRGRYRPGSAPRAESARTWRTLVGALEMTPDVVAVVTRQGGTLYLNQAGRDLLGLSADADLATVHVLETFSPDARRILRGALRAAIRHGYWRGRATLLSAGPEEVPVSQVIIAHRGPDHRIDFFSVIARDLREQRRTE